MKKWIGETQASWQGAGGSEGLCGEEKGYQAVSSLLGELDTGVGLQGWGAGWGLLRSLGC